MIGAKVPTDLPHFAIGTKVPIDRGKSPYGKGEKPILIGTKAHVFIRYTVKVVVLFCGL